VLLLDQVQFAADRREHRSLSRFDRQIVSSKTKTRPDIQDGLTRGTT
jgi:hypothetical protein